MEIYKVLFYLVGVILMTSSIKDRISGDDLGDTDLTHGLLFIILAGTV